MRGGVMLPMFATEAMWLSFAHGDEDYPCAIKIAGGKCEPPVLVARPGSKLTVENDTDVTSFVDLFMVDKRASQTIGVTTSKVVSLGLAKIGVVCVTDDATAVTDASGRFSFESVPAIAHEVRVWHRTFVKAWEGELDASRSPAQLRLPAIKK